MGQFIFTFSWDWCEVPPVMLVLVTFVNFAMDNWFYYLYVTLQLLPI